MISLTAHFINKNWTKTDIVLNVKAMEGSHTGDYLASVFMAMLKDWQISENERF